MLDLVVVDGQARGIIVRNLITGEIERYAGHAVLLCTGGYGTAYYLSTNAVGSNVTAAWRAHKRGRSSPTRASRRFTRPASRCPASTSRSSR
jgi:succinate dehydrogenase / fumarate reductase, flavoprotein subunit